MGFGPFGCGAWGFTRRLRPEGQLQLDLLPLGHCEFTVLTPLPPFGPSVIAPPTMPSADFCAVITGLATRSVRGSGHGTDLPWVKTDRLRRTPAGSTTPTLDGCGLRDPVLARPAGSASYPVLVHQAAVLLHASFRPRLAATPLRFANPSPPSGWVEDFHLQAVEHARHTKAQSRRKPGP